MKARRFPQDRIVLEVVENLQEIIWGKIAWEINGFIKSFIENLLNEEITAKLWAGRYDRTSGRRESGKAAKQ